jgi:hypothetical protein
LNLRPPGPQLGSGGASALTAGTLAPAFGLRVHLAGLRLEVAREHFCGLVFVAGHEVAVAVEGGCDA